MKDQEVRFEVWTAVYDPETGETFEQCELTRTSRDTAQDDARLFRQVCGKRSWVQEVR